MEEEYQENLTLMVLLVCFCERVHYRGRIIKKILW